MSPRRPVVEILDPMVVEILRQKTPAERLAQAFDMWDFAVVMIRSSIRHEHAEWSEAEVLREAARRLSHGATKRVPG
ncbi:MAG: hypothetical protein SH850_05050 [Planctomycetaceae bacterium]|nr:hypothetical protein [Planctomycetaceae bacterium]